MTVTPYEKSIVDYYDHCEVDYRIVWHLKTHLSMHYGYWEPDTLRLRDALVLMNQKLAEHARITAADRVLDAGCGVGGSSIYLARTRGCEVVGITLSDKQVESCRRNAAEAGVAGRATFERANYVSTGFPDGSFDVVWAVESVCHALEKRDFLREARRLLRPGGRLVVADFFSNPLEPGSREARLMDQWARSWAVERYEEAAVFEQKLREEGFEGVVGRDVTANVLPTILRLARSFLPGLVITKVSQWLGLRSRLQTANTWSTWYQYKAWKQGLWRYMIYTAEVK